MSQDSEFMNYTAYAPASIGNVSLGFDLLGAALEPIGGSELGDKVELQPASQFSLQVKGSFADKLPADTDDNIVTRCYDHFREKLHQRGVVASPAKMILHKNLPIGSGLGSSASSIVAALDGLNHFYENPFSQNEMLLMMGELEGQISGSIHYDNVAPCYMGGLTLMVESEQQIATTLPCFDNWYWVVCYSGISVSTSAARKILPTSFPMATTLAFGRQLAVFVDALYRQDENLAAEMMQDVIAEPHRKSLLPFFDESRMYAVSEGALAFGISGSGPTVFAVCNDIEKANLIGQWLTTHYIQNELGFCQICKLSETGSIVVGES